MSVLRNSVDVNYWKPICDLDESPAHRNSSLKILYIPQRSMDGLDSTLEIKGVLASIKRLEGLGINVHLTVVVKAGAEQVAEISNISREVALCIDKIVLKYGLTRDQMRQTYNSNDLMIYQTINDGSPRVVIEALACGLPVLCNPHPGIRVLDENDQYIQFAEYGNMDSITAGLQKMNDMNFLSDIAQKGRFNIEVNFSNEFAANEHEDFYKRVKYLDY